MQKSKPLTRTSSALQQQGFSLIEISIGLILVVGIVVSIYQILEYRAWIEQAKTVAEQIKNVNEAVSTYAGNNSSVLSDKNLPAACEANYYGVVDAGASVNSVNVSAPPASCSKDFGTGAQKVTVRNVLQPTMDELRQLNYLPNGINVAPSFTTENRVVYLDANNRNAFLPPGYAVRIQRVCVNNSSASVDSKNYCDTPNPGYFDLVTLVFSSQPYDDKANKRLGVNNMLYTAYRAAGADALLAADGISRTTDPANGNADITNQFPLVPPNSDGQTFFANPLRTSTGVGVKNILAMRGGYSSSVRSNFVRPDGLSPMTGNLNVGNNNILGVNNIEAVGNITSQNGIITAPNMVASNQLTARTINTSSVSSSGDMSAFNFVAQNQIRANDRIFSGKADDPNCAVSSDQHGGGSGDINACRDMVAKGWVKGFEAVQAGPNNDVGVRLNKDGSIQGKTINVDTNKNVTNINNITQSGGIDSQGVIKTTQDFITAASQKVQAGYFKFLNTVAEGAGCASDFVNSLTLDTNNNDKLLRCNGTTWVSMLQKGDTGTQGVQGVQGPAATAVARQTVTFSSRRGSVYRKDRIFLDRAEWNEPYSVRLTCKNGTTCDQVLFWTEIWDKYWQFNVRVSGDGGTDMEQVVKMERNKLTTTPDYDFQGWLTQKSENSYIFRSNTAYPTWATTWDEYHDFNCKYTDYPNKWNLDCWDW